MPARPRSPPASPGPPAAPRGKGSLLTRHAGKDSSPDPAGRWLKPAERATRRGRPWTLPDRRDRRVPRRGHRTLTGRPGIRPGTASGARRDWPGLGGLPGSPRALLALRTGTTCWTNLSRGSSSGPRVGYLGQLYGISGWTGMTGLWALRQPTLVGSGDDHPIVPLVNGRSSPAGSGHPAARCIRRRSSVPAGTPGTDSGAARPIPFQER